MPQTKSTSTSKRTARVKNDQVEKDQDTLLDFEQFISQKPAVRPSRGKGYLAITLVLIIVILGFLWFFMSQNTNLETAQKFKAIYLDNNQIYYAKVVKEDALNIYLDDIYYIQTEQTTVPAEEEGGEPQVINVPVLVKRGDELHKPEGWMQINRSKVVAIEEIGPDSEIITEINRINTQQ